MKTSAAILLGCVMLWLGCAKKTEEPDFSVSGPAFTPEVLTAEQTTACQSVRTNRNSVGYNAAHCVFNALNEDDPNITEATWHIRGIFRPRYTMTRSNLIGLLGGPDGNATNKHGHAELIYNFVDTKLTFIFNDDGLIGTDIITWD